MEEGGVVRFFGIVLGLNHIDLVEIVLLRLVEH